jgi:hypothetical protein
VFVQSSHSLEPRWIVEVIEIYVTKPRHEASNTVSKFARSGLGKSAVYQCEQRSAFKAITVCFSRPTFVSVGRLDLLRRSDVTYVRAVFSQSQVRETLHFTHATYHYHQS